MNTPTRISLLHSLSKPQLKLEQGMVYKIWEDGEITLTKSGDLYGQRNLHCIVPGMPGVSTELPEKRGSHMSMAVSEEDIALARFLIVGDDDPYKDCLPGKKQTHEQLFEEIRHRHEIAMNRGDA